MKYVVNDYETLIYNDLTSTKILNLSKKSRKIL